jgi:hypothetical protein
MGRKDMYADPTKKGRPSSVVPLLLRPLRRPRNRRPLRIRGPVISIGTAFLLPSLPWDISPVPLRYFQNPWAPRTFLASSRPHPSLPPSPLPPAHSPPQVKTLVALSELRYRPAPEWMHKFSGALHLRLDALEAHSLSEVRNGGGGK